MDSPNTAMPIAIEKMGSTVVMMDTILGPTRLIPSNEHVMGKMVPNSASATMNYQPLASLGNSTLSDAGATSANSQ